jgi:hypothetical protein
MSIQIAFLLVFIAGGLSVWILMRMSNRVEKDRMAVIKHKISAMNGKVKRLDQIDRTHCPFSSEYQDPDLTYKFYKVIYDKHNQSKVCWVTLLMSQRSYGPSSAIQTDWVWRDLA